MFRTLLALTAVLIVASPDACRAATPRKAVIGNKTLVAWVAPANLTQRGGSVLTIEKSDNIFDAIVLGEIVPKKWMAGSNGFVRTEQTQSNWPVETADVQTFVQIAIVYQGNQVTIYRNGEQYADYTIGEAQSFGNECVVLLGLRHNEAPLENGFFTGAIDDARIYDVALDADQIARLKPNELSGPEPIAWWSFEEGSIADHFQRFPASTLFGNARVSEGRLLLEETGAYMLASKSAPKAGATVIDFRNANSTARSLREHLLRDPFRPGYHFVIPEGRGRPFDPNGAIFWKGRYHLFYITNDERGISWGHVSSTDLFHWRHHPTGLIGNMFSGNCFINKEGRPTICYHHYLHGGGGGNAMAVALDDDLNQWEKLESNPITPITQPGNPHHGKYESWDPFAWVEGDTYYAIFGGKGVQAAVAKSKSLAGPWSYTGNLLANTVEGVAIDEDISCADLFKIGDKHMLLCISHRLGCRYYLGDWKNEQFHPTFHEKMSWVDHSFFAPESLLDDRGRRIMWAWIFDRPGAQTRMDHGWSGTMSLPRVLTLGDDGMLRMNVPEEIERLRYNPKEKTNLAISADSELPVNDIRGDSIELIVDFAATEAQQFGVKVCCSPDGQEETLIYYDAVDKKLKIDTNKSSLVEGSKSIEAGPLELKPGEPLRLRVFVDKSVVEVFAGDGRQAVMRRIYPSLEESVGVTLFSKGGSATVTTLKAWDMMPSNPY